MCEMQGAGAPNAHSNDLMETGVGDEDRSDGATAITERLITEESRSERLEL